MRAYDLFCGGVGEARQKINAILAITLAAFARYSDRLRRQSAADDYSYLFLHRNFPEDPYQMNKLMTTEAPVIIFTEGKKKPNP